MKTIFILEKLLSYFQVDTYNKLADKLGISPTTLSNWKIRNSLDYTIIFTKCVDINLNWLIRGEGEMFTSSEKKQLLNKDNELLINMLNEKEAKILELSKRIWELEQENERLKKDGRLPYKYASEP